MANNDKLILPKQSMANGKLYFIKYFVTDRIDIKYLLENEVQTSTNMYYFTLSTNKN